MIALLMKAVAAASALCGLESASIVVKLRLSGRMIYVSKKTIGVTCRLNAKAQLQVSVQHSVDKVCC